MRAQVDLNAAAGQELRAKQSTKMRGSLRVVVRMLSAVGLFFCAAVAANAAGPPSAHWAGALRADIDRVAQIDWRMSTSAARLCTDTSSGVGLRIDSLDAYSRADRNAVGGALGLGPLPQVSSVAHGSPSELAGVAVGDDLVAINGIAVGEAIAPIDGNATADKVETALSQLPLSQPATLLLARDGRELEISLTPVVRCDFVAVVDIDDGIKAYSDRGGLALTTGLISFAGSADRLALIFGHEMAHVLLRGRHDELNIRGKRKEDEADRLGAILASCAGYDMTSAIGFWLSYDDSRPLSFLPMFTHRSGKRRFEILREFLPSIDCANVNLDNF